MYAIKMEEDKALTTAIQSTICWFFLVLWVVWLQHLYFTNYTYLGRKSRYVISNKK